MRTAHPIVLLVTLFIVAFSSFANGQDGVTPDELKVFSPLIGKWQIQIVNRPSAVHKDASTGKAVSTVEWALNGRFVRGTSQATTNSKERMEFEVLSTYDERKKAYRRWLFRSDGVLAESVGEWDADTKTMNWTAVGLPENVTYTVKTQIANHGFTITLVGKRADGTMLIDTTWKAERDSGED